MADHVLLHLARSPTTLVSAAIGALVAFVSAVFALSAAPKTSLSKLLESADAYARFCWNCFIKPHATGSQNQQEALESFYRAQAAVYDKTRGGLLNGRGDMLGLVAANLKMHHGEDAKAKGKKPVWVDVSFPPKDGSDGGRKRF